MKLSPDAPRGLARRALQAAAALCAVAAGASGCTNMQEGVGPPTTVPSISNSAPRNTGTYPNLNIRPQAAAPQLTDEEQAAAVSSLSASAASAESGAATTTLSPEEQERLRKLAEENLAEIEGRK